MVIQALFWFFAIMAASSALITVTRRNPVASALWLIGTFFALAAIYTLLGAFFIGIIQILVYAGAIMVLFLFVIMLLNLGESTMTGPRVTLARVAGGVAAAGLLAVLVLAIWRIPSASTFTGSQAMSQGFGTLAVIGQTIYTQWMLPFEAVSLLLLVGMVGAVVVAKSRI